MSSGRFVSLIILTSATLFGGTSLAQSVDQYESPPAKPFRGTYGTFGGTAGDPQMPRPGDTKVSFNLSGQVAAELYVNMGSAAQQKECVPNDEEIRERGDLTCIREKKTKTVACYFGLDPKTGHTVASIVC